MTDRLIQVRSVSFRENGTGSLTLPKEVVDGLGLTESGRVAIFEDEGLYYLVPKPEVTIR